MKTPSGTLRAGEAASEDQAHEVDVRAAAESPEPGEYLDVVRDVDLSAGGVAGNGSVNSQSNLTGPGTLRLLFWVQSANLCPCLYR